jgi:plastocyanin
MERREVLKAGGVAATAGLTGLAGCGSSNPDASGETDTPSNGDSNTVLMVTEGSDYYFDPIGLFVESGETVTFEIDSGSHSATAYKEGNGQASVTRIPDGAEVFDSGILSEQGATFEHTFETAGAYDYFCTPHKSLSMVGRIVVGEPGGPAEGSMPPDGEVPESQTIVDQGAVSYSDFSG